MGRLGGKGRKSPEGTVQMNKLEVWQHTSMADAMRASDRTVRVHWPRSNRDDWHDEAVREAMHSVPARLAKSLATADVLNESAITADPRLARRAVWRRGEEGDIACPALIAQGDDTPCFYRHRERMTEANGGEPVRVVISTDSKPADADTAAAFIATVRLVQQWRAVEVVWQGAWLAAPHIGWVFHVPLIKGDMDFARLDFCLASRFRDHLSWDIMVNRARDVSHATWNGCAGTGAKSYLPEASHFVRHTGITPDGESIARHAAAWLGWEEPVPCERDPQREETEEEFDAGVARVEKARAKEAEKNAIASAQAKADALGNRTY